MSVLETLTHIVCNICENITTVEQYEAQLDILLKEERIIMAKILETAIPIFNEEEYKQYIAYILRGLSSLSGFLNANLEDGTVNKSSHSFSLRRHALDITERLFHYVCKNFSDKSRASVIITTILAHQPLRGSKKSSSE